MIKNKIKYCALLGVLALGFSSCLKDKPFLDVSNTQAIAEFSIVSPTVSTYSWGALKADTAEIDTAIAVDIASPQTLNYDVTITVTWDPTLITAYNSTAKYPLTALPDSDYSLGSLVVKIPAGYRIGRIPVKLFVSKIDPQISYAMPFTITAVTTSNNGAVPLISGNAKSLMYAFIGNPIAGSYGQEWIRYNTATQTGTPAYDEQVGPSLFTPVTPVEVTAPSGTSPVTYDITFTSTNGVPDPGSFSVTLTAASVAAAGITISGGPTIVTADAVNGVYKFNFQYLNSAGSPRNITDIFTR